MNDIKFSIITPVYNRENIIEHTIKSVLNQQYENWEYIIVDDGSTDNTGTICKKFMNINDKIIYIYI